MIQPASRDTRRNHSIRACQAGHRVLFAVAADRVSTRADARHAGKLQAELVRPGRHPLLVVDEVDYIPFEPKLRSCSAAGANSAATTSPATAMIDRLVHHAEAIALKGDTYRLKGRDLGRIPTAATEDG